MTVPGGCRSQGCHGTLLGSLAAPFCFIRHLPDTHLLLMGLIKVGVSVIPSAEKKKNIPSQSTRSLFIAGAVSTCTTGFF